MRIDLVTLFPGLCEPFLREGVVGRAVTRGVVDVRLWNPRDFTTDRHRTVDDRPYGGGPGMVMRPEPLAAALDAIAADRGDGAPIYYLSPQGRRLDHAGVCEIAAIRGCILLAGRYEGVDERLLASRVAGEWSIGDYVLSGGELAALVVIDAVIRLEPGVLNDEQSAVADSFATGLLDHPHYTRPEVFEGVSVPEALRSGDHQRIEAWRQREALGRTWLRRPDLLPEPLDEGSQRLLAEFRTDSLARMVRHEQDS